MTLAEKKSPSQVVQASNRVLPLLLHSTYFDTKPRPITSHRVKTVIIMVIVFIRPDSLETFYSRQLLQL